MLCFSDYPSHQLLVTLFIIRACYLSNCFIYSLVYLLTIILRFICCNFELLLAAFLKTIWNQNKANLLNSNMQLKFFIFLSDFNRNHRSRCNCYRNCSTVPAVIKAIAAYRIQIVFNFITKQNLQESTIIAPQAASNCHLRN